MGMEILRGLALAFVLIPAMTVSVLCEAIGQGLAQFCRTIVDNINAIDSDDEGEAE